MTRAALRRVLAAATGATPGEWTAAEAAIGAEREAVLRVLRDEPDVPVYGFSTLLGHLDGVDAHDAGGELLRAHLLGPLTMLPGDAVRLVSACKAEQLSHGGSGLDPAAYRAVLAAAAQPAPAADGSWDASYGSGDVVPAAWWLSTLVADADADARAGVDPERPGEVIALINGTFIATAAAILTGARLADGIGRVLSALDAATALPLAAGTAGRQRPVSLRDARPVITGVESALDALGAAIDARLAAPSANPLFTFADGRATALSQSGFLDYRLTWALTNAAQAGLLALATVQRIAEHVARARLEERADPALLQPPKVLQAILERALLSAGTLPGRFSGAESEGIEDLRDLSLLCALRVQGLADDLEAAVPLLHDLGLPIGPDPRPARALLGASEGGSDAEQLLDAIRGVRWSS